MNGATSGTDTKWEAATKVGNMFSTLYGDLVSVLANPNAGASGNKILLTHWHYASSAYQSTDVPGSALVNASTKPQLGTTIVPGGATPIGDALVAAHGKFSSSQWVRRVVIILTDGKHNLWETHDLPAVGETEFPHELLTGNKTDRITLHTVQYLMSGGGFNAELVTLQTASGGTYHDSSADTDPLSSDTLFDMYASVFSSMVPVDYDELLPFSTGAGAGGTHTVTVEPGVDRLVFLATTEASGADQLVLTDGASTAHGNTSTGFGNGFTWVIVDNPVGTSWTVTDHPGGALYVFVDLALRFECGAEPAQVGQPIKLWARVNHKRGPVSGADIRVGKRTPQESVGEVISAFIESGGLRRALQRNYFSAEFIAYLKSLAAGEQPQFEKLQDVPSLQAELLRAAEKERNLPLQFGGNSVALSEVSPGRYEVTVPAGEAENEYTRNFYLSAYGNHPDGGSFSRTRRFSVMLKPVPTAETSTATLTPSAPVSQKVTWKAVTIPRTATKKRVGPGLGNYLVYKYVDPQVRKQSPPLVTIDNLDGSYSTQVTVKEGEKPPAIALYTTEAKDGDKTGIVPVDPSKPCKEVSKVRVRLRKVLVLHDKDLLGKGELVFQS
jgi:hypothetical protein